MTSLASSPLDDTTSNADKIVMENQQTPEVIEQSSKEEASLEATTTESSSSPPPPQQQQQQPPRNTPTAQQMMAAMGTNPRRILLGTASATGIALLGNFLGVTSQLLTLVPEDTLEPTGIDTYFPRGDYKRVSGEGYTFVIPKEWVGDTFVELAKAQRAARPLDYKMSQGGRGVTLPDKAFGPPGRLNPQTGVSEQGDTNVSVIAADGLNGFSLRGTLGSPTEAAEKLIRLSLAPEGSGRTVVLTSAVEDVERQVYQFEYTVDRGNTANKPLLRAISVIAAPAGTSLITCTVTAPNAVWDTDPILAAKLERIASSFHTTI
ncbi:PsbP [Seminavis robusta]|uniref:PsbP n=1 Tax=Seminavis robusta TaxID=568900 RepID=A0A9N8H782_9STRA|nr:PsbP [Seminavis robusta]|eukprot:Sro133_g063170.1 PsbP (320) ;mRNA; f:85388-86644